MPDPHEKISVCVCAETPLFFWINSSASFHGIGQEPVPAAMCPSALKYDSYLDLSGPRQYAEKDLVRARDYGMITPELRSMMVASLSGGNDMLADAHRKLAWGNLKPPAASTPPTSATPATP